MAPTGRRTNIYHSLCLAAATLHLAGIGTLADALPWLLARPARRRHHHVLWHLQRRQRQPSGSVSQAYHRNSLIRQTLRPSTCLRTGWLHCAVGPALRFVHFGPLLACHLPCCFGHHCCSRSDLFFSSLSLLFPGGTSRHTATRAIIIITDCPPSAGIPPGRHRTRRAPSHSFVVPPSPARPSTNITINWQFYYYFFFFFFHQSSPFNTICRFAGAQAGQVQAAAAGCCCCAGYLLF